MKLKKLLTEQEAITFQSVKQKYDAMPPGVKRARAIAIKLKTLYDSFSTIFEQRIINSKEFNALSEDSQTEIRDIKKINQTILDYATKAIEEYDNLDKEVLVDYSVDDTEAQNELEYEVLTIDNEIAIALKNELK